MVCSYLSVKGSLRSLKSDACLFFYNDIGHGNEVDLGNEVDYDNKIEYGYEANHGNKVDHGDEVGYGDDVGYSDGDGEQNFLVLKQELKVLLTIIINTTSTPSPYSNS